MTSLSKKSKLRERERERERERSRSRERIKKGSKKIETTDSKDSISTLISMVQKGDTLKAGQKILYMVHDKIKTSLIPWAIETIDFFHKNHKNYIIIMDPSMMTHWNYLVFTPLFMEVYYMLFHVLVVRLWLFANFCCSLLHMYDNLSESGSRWITEYEIKRYAMACVGSGILLIIFFANSIGILAIPLIIYLINRTLKNIFNRGF